MNQRFSAFLAVAETLSISKAAEQQFVSYQCISGHLRSLEEEYKVKLFERRPQFSLTKDGQILMEALQKIRIIEDGIADAFNDQDDQVVGHVTLGVPSSRYTEIVPSLLAQFKKFYPNVELEIIEDYSTILQKQVERGLLDMAIVVQQSHQTNHYLDSTILAEEQFLFLLSPELAEKYLKEETASRCQSYKKSGITLDEISRFPIVSYPKSSRLRHIMDHYASNHNLMYHIVFESNRVETFDAIARTHIAGCIIPQQVCDITARNNRHLHKEKRLQVFRINWRGYKVDNSIALLRNRNSTLATYKQRLIQIIKDDFAGYEHLTK